MSATCRLSVIEIDEHRLPLNPSPAQIEEGLRQEGVRISEHLKKGLTVALCVEAEQLSSLQFSEWIEKAAVSGVQSITFVIGGSHGLSEQIKSACDQRVSLSKMTFPHQLFRVMLLEQIYRALNISHGGKYNK